jgi:hypothetical protein
MATKSYNKVLKDILLSKPTSFIFILKDEEHKVPYDQFNSDFEMYLSKLPNNNVKKYVMEVFNRDLIYLGSNQISKNVNVYFSKIEASGDRMKKIVLDLKEFDININTGETKNIDECIYATYFSFIRFAVLTNRTIIKNDDKLQEKLAQYFYQIMVSVSDTKNINTPKQKFFFKLVAYYAFYRHFIRETSAMTIKNLRNIFKKDKEYFNEFKNSFKEIDKYKTVKDFPKMLIDTNVLKVDPNTFSINLLRKYKQLGFYCIYGSLDMFTAFTVITKYPFEMFARVPVINTSLQKEVEEIMIGYMRKVKFAK